MNATVDMAFCKKKIQHQLIASSGFVAQTTSGKDQATTPYTFAHGVLKTSTGGSAIAEIAEVQDVDITMANKLLNYYGD